MPLRHSRPGRRSTAPALILALMTLALATGACSLNPGPVGEAIGDGPPVVRLVSPLPNASYLDGVSVNIQASVSNAGPDIDRVEVTVDGAIVTTLPEPNPGGLPVFSVADSWPASGAGTHEVGVTAFRADGSASAPATVRIMVISSATVEQPTATPTEEPTPEPEQTDENGGGDDGGDGDEPDATATPSSPVATFNQGVNVRSGPGTNFNPPIGSFAAGQTADVTGVNPAGDWYKVRYYNADGWVFASLLTVAGDTDDLPVDPGPPTPVPATPIPTSPPATAVPATQANLVAGNIRINPPEPSCGEGFTISVDLANLGSEPTSTTGLFSVQDVHVASGTVTTSTEGPIQIIEAGQTVASPNIPLTVNTYYEEEHKIVVVLNPSGSIPETGSGDNRREQTYTLRRGDC